MNSAVDILEEKDAIIENQVQLIRVSRWFCPCP
jgi:hypothetical protein